MNWPDCWKKNEKHVYPRRTWNKWDTKMFKLQHIIRGVYLCMYVYICVCIYLWNLWRSASKFRCFPQFFYTLFSEISLTWSLKFVASTNLADQQVPGILTSLCPECEITARTWVFTWVLGTRAKIYMQERQSLYGLGHLPSPYIQYYWLHILLL